jgi:DNA-binding HxlR family transcriptional regulator
MRENGRTMDEDRTTPPTAVPGDRPARTARDTRATRTARDTRDRSCERVLVDCRLRAATELFAHTWDPVILAGLSEGPLRRAELRTLSGGISDKVLTESLRRLLGNGLIERRTFRAAPPRVDYGLTPLGTSLVDGPMRAMGDWTREHGEELLEAQERAAGRAAS